MRRPITFGNWDKKAFDVPSNLIYASVPIVTGCYIFGK